MLRLVGERRVVHESGDLRRSSRSIIVTGGRGSGDRLVDAAAVFVDPALAVAEPIDDLERGIVERRPPGRCAAGPRVERHENPRGRRPVEAAAEDACEERETARRRTRSGRAPRRRSRRDCRPGRPRPHEQEGERRPTREIDTGRSVRRCAARRLAASAGEDHRDPRRTPPTTTVPIRMTASRTPGSRRS